MSPAQSRRFANQVVIVTGASTGLGRTTACAFASEGARLALAARHPEPLREAAAAVAQAGGGVPPLVMPCDVTRRDQVQEWSPAP